MKRFGITALFVLTFGACDRGPIEPRARVEGCSGVQSWRRGTMTVGKATWHASDSPHVLADTVNVTDTLTIEAGATLCAPPSSRLNVTVLIAQGTAQQPIKFIPLDSAQNWVLVGEMFTRIRLKHVQITSGIVSGYNVDVEDSEIRRGSVSGCNLNMLRTVLDSGVASLPGGALEDNVFRRAKLWLNTPRFLCGGTVALNGGRIEDSPGVAIEWNSIFLYPPAVTSTRPIRIIRSRGYPVKIALSTFDKIWPTPEAQDSLMGNINDTLALNLHGSFGVRPRLHIRRGLPVRLDPGYQINFLTVDTLTMEPGAFLSLGATRVVVRSKATVLGTTELPIRISRNGARGQNGDDVGVRLRGSGASDFSNVIFSQASISTAEQHFAKLTRIDSNDWIDLGSPGSELTDSEIHDVSGNGYHFGSTAALRLSAPGVSATRVIVRRVSGTGHSGGLFDTAPLAAIAVTASDVRISSCNVTDNAADAVRVNGSNVQVNDCNIERNGGFGVNNLGTARVDARRNWWGDPAGPFAPNGDAVNGDVDYSEHRFSPATSPKPIIRRW